MSTRNLVILTLVTCMVTSLVSCRGANEQTSVVQANTAQTLPVKNNDDWVLQIDDSVFSEEKELAITYLEPEAVAHPDFTFIGSPISIVADDTLNTRLENPVLLEVPLIEDQETGYEEEAYFFGYFHEGTWEFYPPVYIDLDRQIAVFELYHFSSFGFGTLSEEEQLKHYAKTMAQKDYDRKEAASQLLESTRSSFDDVFTSLGVQSPKTRNQLTADLVSYLENSHIDSSGTSPIDALVQMANAASQGEAGKLAFQNKLLEFTGKGLVATLEQNVASWKDTTGALVMTNSLNYLGNLSSAAGAIAEGDSQGALASVGGLLKTAVPQAGLAESALLYLVDKGNKAIDSFAAGELEKAYQVYIGNGAGKWGYDSGMEGDIDAIFTTLGGGQRVSDQKFIDAYCKGKGLDSSKLSQAEKDRIIGEGRKELKEYFDRRSAMEKEVNKNTAVEEDFIKALKNKGLLSSTNYENYFGLDKASREVSGAKYSITSRLDRLYKIKNLVVGMMDPSVVEKMTPDELAYVIDRWIYYSEKNDRAGFLDFLKKAQYLKPVITEQENYGWVLQKGTQVNDWKALVDESNELNPNYKLNVSPSGNSATFVLSYLGPESGWMKTGYTQSGSVSWTNPSPSTAQPGDAVELKLESNHLGRDHDYQSGIGSVVAVIFKIDQQGSQVGPADYMASEDGATLLSSTSSVGYATQNATVTGTLPGATGVGDRCVIQVSASSGGVAVQTWYIYEWKSIQ